MNQKELKALVTDWRVAILIILVILSVIAIYPHFDEKGNIATNLQYGLDLQQGAWIQLEFKGEVVGFTTDEPVDTFIANLSKQADAEVIYVDETHLEIRKFYTQAELEPLFETAGGKITSYSQGVSKSTADTVKRVLEKQDQRHGHQGCKGQYPHRFQQCRALHPRGNGRCRHETGTGDCRETG